VSYSEFYGNAVSRNMKEKGQAGSALTGTIAALLAADGVIWTFRYPESSVMPSAGLGSKRLYVQRVSVTIVTGTAFTTPVTLGRHLKLVRGAPTSGTASNPSGGAAYTPVRKRSDSSSNSGETLGVGRVATTAALTTTGITFESAVIRRLPMSAAGSSGSLISATWSFGGQDADPVYLLPGELLAVAAGATMDAAGTFEAYIDVDAVEVP
jgi:hypothetical protein